MPSKPALGTLPHLLCQPSLSPSPAALTRSLQTTSVASSSQKVVTGASATGVPQVMSVVDKYRARRLPGLEQYTSDQSSFNEYMVEDQKVPAYVTVGIARAMWTGIGRSIVIRAVGQMSAAADVLALSSIEVDISGFAEGSCTTVKWQGKPVFIKHRTPAEIATAKADDTADLRDKETDAQRTQKPEWQVLIGVCTHLGCVPIPGAGEYPGGYFCPCHGSHYDQSGRIRKGPAPLNLEIPPYKFLDDKTMVIG